MFKNGKASPVWVGYPCNVFAGNFSEKIDVVCLAKPPHKMSRILDLFAFSSEDVFKGLIKSVRGSEDEIVYFATNMGPINQFAFNRVRDLTVKADIDDDKRDELLLITPEDEPTLYLVDFVGDEAKIHDFPLPSFVGNPILLDYVDINHDGEEELYVVSMRGDYEALLSIITLDYSTETERRARTIAVAKINALEHIPDEVSDDGIFHVFGGEFDGDGLPEIIGLWEEPVGDLGYKIRIWPFKLHLMGEIECNKDGYIEEISIKRIIPYDIDSDNRLELITFTESGFSIYRLTKRARKIRVKKIYDLKIFKSEFENIQVELERLDNLIMEGEEQEHNLESKIENIQEMLSRIEKILKILEVIAKRQEIGNIVTELESIKRQLKNFEDLPEKISIVDKKIRENEIERIKVKHELQFIENEVSRLKSRLQKVKKIRENKKEYLEKIEKLKELYNTITAIRKAIREIQTKIRKESLVKIRDEMNNVFRKIYVHPDYDALNIKIITPPGEQSKSIYEIYARRSIDKAWIPVHVKLSDGQKSVIAYSLLGAFFQVAKHRIGFMIIDEPLLNVDEECKKAWMEAMISLRQLGQLIIASQDRSLLEIRKLYPQTIAYMFSHGGIEGPKIRRL